MSDSLQSSRLNILSSHINGHGANNKFTNLSLKKKKKSSWLKLHLDLNLFYDLLRRKYSWNQPLSGSLIMFERKPNIFDPNITSSLNFLTT